MIILGWLLSIGGAITAIVGMTSYNDASSAGYGYYHHIDASDINSARMTIIVGAVLLILGIAFLIIGYIRSSKNANNSKNRFNTRKCLNCGNILPIDVRFCPQCGNNMDTQG